MLGNEGLDITVFDNPSFECPGPGQEARELDRWWHCQLYESEMKDFSCH